ncbi:unnamed protein product [Triticum turgidum subsp. durum]|uniref:Uncharacterized protein n=1 Tax=Triticum turgidum subsp. durum TaxID=4567 RepID=A0A9R1NHL3_TRITD|nr:unnamed protein product [Triticum turgidum subsp. durum]
MSQLQHGLHELLLLLQARSPSPQAALVVSLLLVCPLLVLLVARRFGTPSTATVTARAREDQLSKLPSPPSRLPIIGHLHLVGPLPHVSLRDLAAEHGRDGLMLLRLGAVPTLIVSSPSAAQAVLRTHDQVFASRAYSPVTDILFYGSTDVAFCPYGEHWRQVKKIATTHLLTNKKVRLVVAKIREAATTGIAMDMSDLLNAFANDIVCHAVAGKSFRKQGHNKLFRELVEANSSLIGGFNLEDYFPVLVKLDFIKRMVCAKARKVNKMWDKLLNSLIDEHARRPASEQGGEESDFIDVLLSIQQEYNLTRDHIKAQLEFTVTMANSSSPGCVLLAATMALGVVLLASPAESARAFFVFGDSLVHNGDNNYLMSMARADSPPYGIDYPMHQPTGRRFSNGLNIPDIISEHLGAEPTLPYLSPELHGEKLLVGANFASAGVGILNDTGIQFMEMVRMSRQLQYFHEYQGKLRAVVGASQATQIVNRALVLITLGGNDFVNNYFFMPFSLRSLQFSLPNYVRYLISEYKKILVRLYDMGARRVLVTGTGPLGCTPAQLARSRGGKCDADPMRAAELFNPQLTRVLEELNARYGDGTFIAANTFRIHFDFITDPRRAVGRGRTTGSGCAPRCPASAPSGTSTCSGTPTTQLSAPTGSSSASS